MLRASETASRTDTGRQRPDNEDSFLVRVPLFVVADGMGGAQAGEVASRLAVDAFRAGVSDAGTPEERLVQTVKTANRQIHALSQEEAGRQGMGTTLTAALLEEDRLTVAHVGDSRAYLFRAGVLRRLTEDHSLVAELVRRGKLTEAQAEEHPQRSIITRALGPEPEVDVDTWTYPVRGGDVVLLCSDGLTAMLTEDQIAEVLVREGQLPTAAAALIAAANQAGGRDNITVILTRLEDLGEVAAEHATMVRSPSAPVSTEPERLDPGASRAGSATMVLSEAERDEILARSAQRGDGAATSPAPVNRADPSRARSGGKRHQPSRRRSERLARPVAALASTLAVVLLIGGGGYLASRQLYFIGTDSRGIVTIYRGLPYDLPLGISLYESFYTSGVPAALVPPARRGRLFAHNLRSQSDAQGVIRDLELGRISG